VFTYTVELKKTICDIEFEDAMSINIICRLTVHIISRTLLSKSVWEVKWLLALVRDIHKQSYRDHKELYYINFGINWSMVNGNFIQAFNYTGVFMFCCITVL